MGKPTILIVDDDYVSMLPLRDLLSEVLDCQVELTAEEQLPSRLSSSEFDLICLDLMIHSESFIITESGEQKVVHNVHFDKTSWKQTGLEFLIRLRKGAFSQEGSGTSPNVPVFVLSATADQATVEKVESYGKDTPTWFIEKPFPPRAVIRRIQDVLVEA